jgi:type III secretion protein C
VKLRSTLAMIALLSHPVTLFAAEPPFTERTVTLTARDREIGEFLRDFFAAAGQNATVDPQVTGKVNGRFDGKPEQIWKQLAQAFNLVAYSDGATTTVYSAAQVQSRSFSVPSGRSDELAAKVEGAGLLDGNNRLRRAAPDLVMATGVPRYLDQVEQLAGSITRLQPTMGTRQIAPPGTAYPRLVETGINTIEPYELRVFYLRYARADDTTLNAGGRQIRVPGVGATLSRVMGDGAVTGGITAGYSDIAIRQSQPRLLGRGLDSVAPDASRSTPYDDDEYLGIPPRPPAEDIRGQAGNGAQNLPQRGPRIAIDPALNAVIVRDRPENMPAYEGLVQALDVRPQIVELEATIIDLNVERLQELGINWRFRSEGFNSLFGGDIVTRTGNPLTDIANTGAASSGLSLGGVIGSNREFIGRLSALAEKGAARIVSRPQLVTLSNVEAVFDRSRTFYVRVAGGRQVDLFNVTAGTVLRVNPHVLSENGRPRIRMVIGVEDGSVLDSRVDRIPVVERASVNTQALINEGEGLLLGGMTVNSDYDAESGIPLLKDIPVLGNLFKSQTKQRRRIERLFLITPRLIDLDAVTPASASAGGTSFGVSHQGSVPNAAPLSSKDLPTPNFGGVQ